eukprot:Tamp_26896.p3 GENE.Tamp_26896~~Tamp_26896.p3  ORF type:complete len:101 (+),score=21.63 Tamp_26896:40-303(+)
MRGKFSNRQGHSKGAFPLTSKRGPRDFYKGKGAKSTGRLTKKGIFIVQPHKLEEFVVPDLEGCELKPYVAYNTPKLQRPDAEESAQQ